MKNIPFIKPNFPDPAEISEDLKRIYANNYYSNNGPVYFEFKYALESFLGQDIKAVVVSNATQALTMAIQAVFREGKKGNKKYVAIPSFTFAAGPLAIKWCGFEPVFFDIDLETAQPSLESFHELLASYEDELAGVILINDFGIGNPEIEAWRDLLDDKQIPFIIDSAPGFGATYSDGRLIGGEGECEIFSFHATKPFGIGEGGLITTTNAQLAEKLESLKNFGFNAEKQTVHLGTNAKITELDCAIGLRILGKYKETLADRRKTYKLYQTELIGTGQVNFLPHAETAAIQFASIIVKSSDQQTILERLDEGEVEARTYYAPAIHTFPYFENTKKVSLQNTEELSKKIISLPVHPNMPDTTVHYICDIITLCLEES